MDDKIQIVKEAANLGESIIHKTGSELILFFIIAACVFIPTYWLWTRFESKQRQKMIEHESEQRQKMMEHQDLIIQVIKDNTVVMSGVKVLLETHGDHTDKSMARLHDRLDNLHKAIHNVGVLLAKRPCLESGGDTEKIQREFIKNFRHKSRPGVHEQEESQDAETV